jgi:Cu(I)/Ag(I) efflux system membrane protein CusA/SilA
MTAYEPQQEKTLIHRVIEFSGHNRFLVLALVAAAVAYAVYAVKNIRLDAIPDLSDTQVIVYTKWDRSPDIVEDQVTYPIISALLGAPKVKAIRGFSDFGFSYVYVIFQDGTDIYWARSRVVEYLQKIAGSLPAGVSPQLGSDATGVGWVFQYALVDKSGKHNPAELRSYQDWNLRYALQSVPGVAEVAGIGGFQKQYQVTIDPAKLQSFGLSAMDVAEAIRKSNNEVGGRLIEWSGREYMVRGRGYVQDTAALNDVVVKTGRNGTPVLLGEVATIQTGPQMRRGVSDLDGKGDTVGGVVVMRHGENALNVIKRVKARLEELKPSMPEGVEAIVTYDRSELIQKSIDNLKEELLVEMIVVSLVIMFFLFHLPSASVPIVTIPISVLLGFIPMYFMGISSNIMSLAGFAISIGVLVDGAIVEVENAYKKLEIWQETGRRGAYRDVLMEAIKEVAPSVFFSLLVIAVSFLPVFTLIDQEGRLFRPLAYTKTLVIGLAAFLAVTLDPAVRMLFVRMEPFRFRFRPLSRLLTALCVGKYYPEEKHPVSRVLFRLYEKPCRLVLRWPKTVIFLAVAVVAGTVPVYLKLGSEFMPPLNEGTILYMPTTLPGISVTEAQRLMETQDRIIRSFPEVVSVFGKAGRIDSSTDPAPFSMMETTVVLKPMDQWRAQPRFFSKWPRPFRHVLGHIWPEHISWEDLIGEMDAAMQIPGCVNAWTMPIKGRIDMLSTGVRTPIGIKIFGASLDEIERIGAQIETTLRAVPGTRSIYAERASGGFFVDIKPDRKALARYSLTIDDLHGVIMTAIGGETITTTIEGRERHTINLRYPRDLRSDLDQLQRVLVTARRMRAGAETANSGGMPESGAGRGGQDGVMQIPPVGTRRDHAGERPGHDPRRERHARGLCLCRYRRPRHRRLCGRCQKGGRPPIETADGVLPDVERAVREHDAGERASEGRHPRHGPVDLPAALHEHQVRLQGFRGDAGRAFLGRGRGVADVPARLQRFDRRVGRHDRLDGARRRNGRVHVVVPGPVLRGRQAKWEAPRRGRPSGSHRVRRGQTHSPQTDDGGGGVDGPDADYVVGRDGGGPDEAGGGPDGRRALHLVPAGTAGLSGGLFPVAETRAVRRAGNVCYH